jgi:hypothetical protein
MSAVKLEIQTFPRGQRGPSDEFNTKGQEELAALIRLHTETAAKGEDPGFAKYLGWFVLPVALVVVVEVLSGETIPLSYFLSSSISSLDEGHRLPAQWMTMCSLGKSLSLLHSNGIVHRRLCARHGIFHNYVS